MNHSDNILYGLFLSDPPSEKPVNDELTRIVTTAMRRTIPTGTCQEHRCLCGVHMMSSGCRMPSGRSINPLAIHLVAFHRHNIPEETIDRLFSLNCNTSDLAEPTPEDLLTPHATITP